MYSSSSFISITDVRKNFSGVIDTLPKEKQKVIFRNNKPTAVLVDFYYFEQLEKFKTKNEDFIVEDIECLIE
jgi:PHD/YefM family antitoxin component YafN of YafNO toxin-antitoxin module